MNRNFEMQHKSIERKRIPECVMGNYSLIIGGKKSMDMNDLKLRKGEDGKFLTYCYLGYKK